MKTILTAFLTLVIVASMSGLDFSIDPRFDPYLIKDYTIYSTKGSPTLIHCRTQIHSKGEESVRLKIITSPSFGTVKIVNDGIYYEPNLKTSKGEDRFTVETVSAHGKRTANILISPIHGCENCPVINYVWL